MPIKVSIVDDDSSFREQYRAILNGAPGFRCVSVHPNAAHALKHLLEARPDVVLVDIKMPKLTGIGLVRRLKAKQPCFLALMLTKFDDDELIFDSLKAGAIGYLLKRSKPAEVLAAIEEACRGGSPMTPEIARRVALFFHETKPGVRADEKLTPREEEVLRLVQRGDSSKEIGRTLDVSPFTIHNHLRQIYDKLHVRCRTAAVKKFFG